MQQEQKETNELQITSIQLKIKDGHVSFNSEGEFEFTSGLTTTIEELESIINAYKRHFGHA